MSKKKKVPSVRVGQVWRLRGTYRRVEEVEGRTAITSARIGAAGRFSTVTQPISFVKLRSEWKLWRDAPQVSA